MGEEAFKLDLSEIAEEHSVRGAMTLKSIFDGLIVNLSEQNENSWNPLKLAPTRDPDKPPESQKKIKADPKLFLTDILGVTKTWAGQDKLMEMIVSNERISVASGQALGKDFIAARLILLFLYSYMPSIVIATAASDRQVDKIIWGELNEGFSNAVKFLPGTPLTKQLVVDEKMKWYAMGFSTKDIKNVQGKFQGYHQKNVLILFSEAQAIEPGIWEQAESLMTGGNVKWIAIGNPLVSHGKFYETFQANSGWKNMTLSCEDSPNVQSGIEIIPGLCSKKWVDGMLIRCKGNRDHALYRPKVRGLFPLKSDDGLVEMSWLEWARNEGDVAIPAQGLKIAGVDIASMGGDKTVATIRHGMRVVEVIKREKQDTMATVDMIVELINYRGVSRVYLDVTGIGTGVYDRLIQLGHGKKIMPINFGGKPWNDPNEEMETNDSELMQRDRYADMATQMYATFALTP